MLLLVNQHSKRLQPNLKWQFKKLLLLRLLTENIFVFLLQYSGLNLSTLSIHASPLWFATGTSCAFLFLRGYSILPGIWLGTFLAYYLAKAAFWLAFGCAIVLSLQAVFLRWFNYRYLLSPTLIFYRLQMYVKFVLFTATLTALVSVVLIFMYSLLMPHREISFQLWLQYWLGNLNAILIFSCALITWDNYFPRSYPIRQLKKTLLPLYALVVLITLALSISHTLMATILLALPNLFIIGFIGANYGWGGAITASFISGILLGFAAFMGAAVFNTPFISLTFPLLQLLLCMESIVGVVFAIKYR
jgi:integral membrane sensor domain MASE1